MLPEETLLPHLGRFLSCLNEPLHDPSTFPALYTPAGVNPEWPQAASGPTTPRCFHSTHGSSLLKHHPGASAAVSTPSRGAQEGKQPQLTPK